jgi:hypothetical protein
VKTEQINALLGVLREIRDRLPALTVVSVTAGASDLRRLDYPSTPYPPRLFPSDYMVDVAYEPPGRSPAQTSGRVDLMPPVKAGAVRDSQRSAWMREALGAVLEVLDDWIEGAWQNHGALDHRGESIGSECWRQFAPGDFRRMVEDAARQLHIEAPDMPVTPREDEVGR